MKISLEGKTFDFRHRWFWFFVLDCIDFLCFYAVIQLELNLNGANFQNLSLTREEVEAIRPNSLKRLVCEHLIQQMRKLGITDTTI